MLAEYNINQEKKLDIYVDLNGKKEIKFVWNNCKNFHDLVKRNNYHLLAEIEQKMQEWSKLKVSWQGRILRFKGNVLFGFFS